MRCPEHDCALRDDVCPRPGCGYRWEPEHVVSEADARAAHAAAKEAVRRAREQKGNR